MINSDYDSLLHYYSLINKFGSESIKRDLNTEIVMVNDRLMLRPGVAKDRINKILIYCFVGSKVEDPSENAIKALFNKGYTTGVFSMLMNSIRNLVGRIYGSKPKMARLLELYGGLSGAGISYASIQMLVKGFESEADQFVTAIKAMGAAKIYEESIIPLKAQNFLDNLIEQMRIVKKIRKRIIAKEQKTSNFVQKILYEEDGKFNSIYTFSSANLFNDYLRNFNNIEVDKKEGSPIQHSWLGHDKVIDMINKNEKFLIDSNYQNGKNIALYIFPDSGVKDNTYFSLKLGKNLCDVLKKKDGFNLEIGYLGIIKSSFASNARILDSEERNIFVPVNSRKLSSFNQSFIKYNIDSSAGRVNLPYNIFTLTEKKYFHDIFKEKYSKQFLDKYRSYTEENPIRDFKNIFFGLEAEDYIYNVDRGEFSLRHPDEISGRNVMFWNVQLCIRISTLADNKDPSYYADLSKSIRELNFKLSNVILFKSLNSHAILPYVVLCFLLRKLFVYYNNMKYKFEKSAKLRIKGFASKYIK